MGAEESLVIEFRRKGIEMLNAVMAEFVVAGIKLVKENEKFKGMFGRTKEGKEVVEFMMKYEEYLRYKCKSCKGTGNFKGTNVRARCEPCKGTGVSRIGYCTVENCQAIGVKIANRYTCQTKGHKWEQPAEKCCSAKRFFKGILNVGALVCAVIVAIVEPGLATTAISQAVDCVQSLWDLGSEEIVGTFKWLKPNTKLHKRDMTAANLMEKLEAALGGIDFKMRHVEMEKTFRDGLQRLKDIFIEHSTKYKVLRQKRSRYGELAYTKPTCTKCVLIKTCPKCMKGQSYFTDKGNNDKWCKSCGGDALGADHAKHVTLRDYKLILQNNWTLQQTKRNMKYILLKLRSTQKDLEINQGIIQDTLESIGDIIQRKVAEATGQNYQPKPNAKHQPTQVAVEMNPVGSIESMETMYSAASLSSKYSRAAITKKQAALESESIESEAETFSGMTGMWAKAYIKEREETEKANPESSSETSTCSTSSTSDENSEHTGSCYSDETSDDSQIPLRGKCRDPTKKTKGKTQTSLVIDL